MSLETTYEIERSKWDSLAPQNLDQSYRVPDGEDFVSYANRCSTMPGIAEFLGDLRGKRVLEYGCGLGQITTLLAKSGAEVTAFDLSAASIDVARRRVDMNNVGERVQFTVCSGEDLPYEDESFDVVFGKAILHHLDMDAGQGELLRVVRPGGKAAFTEPMGVNPLLRFARSYLPYPHKNPRGADIPLHYREIHGWGAGFSQYKFREIQLLSMLERAIGFGRPLPALRKADHALLHRVPALRRYCRYVVMLMVK